MVHAAHVRAWNSGSGGIETGHYDGPLSLPAALRLSLGCGLTRAFATGGEVKCRKEEADFRKPAFHFLKPAVKCRFGRDAGARRALDHEP